jgi:1-deoxy-D-xylulose-5-phosphate synthase
MEIGKAVVVEPGRVAGSGYQADVVFLGLGALLPMAQEAAAKVREAGFSAAVINPRFTKPLDRDVLAEYARHASLFVTLEDHVLMGGFGSAVLEAFSEMGLDVPVERIGWPDKFIDHGKVDSLRARHGITAAAAADRAFAHLKTSRKYHEAVV